MANNLIAVSPFHDLELIEFVSKLPGKCKIKGEIGKYIMKESFRSILPKHTLKKKKKGFDMPIEEWLIKKVPDFVRDVLLDRKTLNRGYFNKKFLGTMVNNFLKGKTDYASGGDKAIIVLLTLELWHRTFIDV